MKTSVAQKISATERKRERRAQRDIEAALKLNKAACERAIAEIEQILSPSIARAMDAEAVRLMEAGLLKKDFGMSRTRRLALRAQQRKLKRLHTLRSFMGWGSA